MYMFYILYTVYYVIFSFGDAGIEPFSFGGLYGTKSKFGDFDVTGDGAMEFFTNRRKITQKWTASYSSGPSAAPDSKKARTDNSAAIPVDKANFDGRM